ncbi:MAG: transaldolase [Candidatus Daviesbacteria bacterium]|nr:transaldolase [Candidatus Daviesbacteria bacterium]
MRPSNLKTKIFLDSGDVNETKEIINALGFLDGQTTNPTLIAKNPDAQKRLAEGNKFEAMEIMAFYKSVVTEVSSLIPEGSVSVEVYADKDTSAEELLKQGKDMFTWIPNAHIKYPTTTAGLEAANRSIAEGMRVNMTLIFSEEQAAAVYAATKGAKKGDVFVSPFVGRLDDKGLNGMDLIKNIVEMYKKGDGHSEVLSASVRNMDHFLASIAFGADIITAPFKVLKEWAEKGMPIPDAEYVHETTLQSIPYQEIDLEKPWQEYNIVHEMTDAGIDRFASDWNGLIKSR